MLTGTSACLSQPLFRTAGPRCEADVGGIASQPRQRNRHLQVTREQRQEVMQAIGPHGVLAMLGVEHRAPKHQAIRGDLRKGSFREILDADTV